MEAITFSEYGPPEVLHLVDIPQPVPRTNEVLIRVRAAGLNAADWRMMRASPFLVRLYSGLFRPKQVTSPGSDVAGIVEAVGAEVTRFKLGDEVYGEVFASHFGGCAEYKCALESELELKPSGISFEEAAVLPLAGMTALQALRDAGQIRAGQRVLINGASGGVGTFALQLAKHFGAEVTAVCSTKKMELARALGADHVVDYTQEDFTASGKQYDLIVVANGYHPLADYRRAMAEQGRMVLIGGQGTGGEFLKMALLGPLLSLGEKKFILWSAKAKGEDLRLLGGLVASGRLKCVIDRRYPLAQGAEAIRYLEQGHASGKVVVTV